MKENFDFLIDKDFKAPNALAIYFAIIYIIRVVIALGIVCIVIVFADAESLSRFFIPLLIFCIIFLLTSGFMLSIKFYLFFWRIEKEKIFFHISNSEWLNISIFFSDIEGVDIVCNATMRLLGVEAICLKTKKGIIKRVFTKVSSIFAVDAFALVDSRPLFFLRRYKGWPYQVAFFVRRGQAEAVKQFLEKRIKFQN